MSSNFNKDDVAHHLGNIEGKLDIFITSMGDLTAKINDNEKDLCNFKQQSLELHNKTREYTQDEITKLKIFQAKMGGYVALFLTGFTIILSTAMPFIVKKLFS